MGEVEGGCIRLAQLELHHPLLGTTALQQQAYSHYMRAAMPELVKLVGSANLLGRISSARGMRVVTLECSSQCSESASL